MGTFRYDLGGAQAEQTFPDDLDAYWEAQPGYTKVLAPAQAEEALARIAAEVAELKGSSLKAAAEQIGLEPGLSADEQREAILSWREHAEQAGADVEPGLPSLLGDRGPELITGTDITEER